MSRQQIRDMIMDCLTALNKERPSDKQIQISPEMVLLAEDSQLDSLDFVALSVDLEDRLRRATGRSMELSPGAMAEDEHPLRTVTTLAEYIDRKLTTTAAA